MSQPFSAWQRGLRQPNLLVGMLLSSCLLLCAHCIEILCAHASGCRCHIHVIPLFSTKFDKFISKENHLVS